jgi:hypothetical protein
MCTVTVVPGNDEMIFTFNRDEHIGRTTAYFNQVKNVGHKNIYFTKDSKAGGSWFAVDDKGTIAMLFNGAFTPHTKKESYTKSRGLILLELISDKESLLFFEKYNLEGVEPFSIILYHHKLLFRLVWNGTAKTIISLEKEKSHIFSSVTLYNDQVQQNRKQWLEFFISQKEVISAADMFSFHQNTQKEDAENGLIINRNSITCTMSISQAVINQQSSIALKHFNIFTKEIIEHSINN